MSTSGAAGAYGKKDWVLQLVTWKKRAWDKYGGYSTTSKTPKLTWQELWQYDKAFKPDLYAARRHADDTPTMFGGESSGGAQLIRAQRRYETYMLTTGWSSEALTGTGFMSEKGAAKFWDEFQRVAMDVNAIWGVKTAWETAKDSLKETIDEGMPKMPWWVKWAGYGVLGLIVMNVLQKGEK